MSQPLYTQEQIQAAYQAWQDGRNNVLALNQQLEDLNAQIDRAGVNATPEMLGRLGTLQRQYRDARNSVPVLRENYEAMSAGRQ